MNVAATGGGLGGGVPPMGKREEGRGRTVLHSSPAGGRDRGSII